MSPPTRVAERRPPVRRRPRVEPRIAAAKSAVTRAQGRRRLRVALVALVVLALALAALVAVHSAIFSARHVAVRGAAHTGVAEVLAVTGLGRRPPLIDISPAADEASLEALPWVATARVVRRWPDTVQVTLTERRAVADVALAGHEVALLDDHGRVLAEGASPTGGLVALKVSDVPAPGATLVGDGPELAEVAGALPRSLAPSVALIARGSLGVVLTLRSGPSVVIGTTSVLGQKMVALATLAANVKLTGNEQVDLRVPSAPVLTP